MSESYSKYYTFNVEGVGLCKTEGKFPYNKGEYIEVIGNCEAHEDCHEYYHLMKQRIWKPDPDSDNHDLDKALIIAAHLNKDEPPT